MLPTKPVHEMSSSVQHEQEPSFEDVVSDLGSSGLQHISELVRDAPFGVYVDHPSRGCIYVNPVLLSFFGLTWEQMRGYGWTKAVHPDDIERVGLAIEQYEYNRLPFDMTYRIRVKGLDTPRWIYSRAQAVLDDDKNHVASIAVVRDVTRERELSSRIEQGQKLEAVGRLSARLAHDINNLLTALIGNTDILAQELDSPLSQRCLENIYSAFDQARYLTGQLLTLSRKHAVESGLTPLDEELKFTERLLESVVGVGVKLNFDLNAGDACVALSSAQLGQIVINLLTNSKDAMLDKGEVSILTKLQNDRVFLVVEDSGPGLDEETLSRALEPFYTTKDVGKGTGLGLATVRSLTEYAGGEVRLENLPDRTGARVSLLLPRMDPESMPKRKKLDSLELANTKGLRIFILEDNDAVRQSICYSLALLGCEVTAAGNLAEAKETVSEVDEIDVVVADILLPDGLGTEFVDFLRESRPELPAVLCSGFSGDALEGKLDNPQTVFVEKPYRAKQIMEAVNALCVGRKLQKP